VELDLHELVDSTVRVAGSSGNGSGVRVVTDIGADVPRFVTGDPTRLRQVLSNLVGNAVKFTHEGEVVTTVKCIATVGKTARVSFSVRDTGIGMSPETLGAIFEPFRQADSSMTRRYGGTGLGLTISRRLVELMGGHLVVTSQEGKGSEFSFELFLPVVTRPPTDANVAAPEAKQPIRPPGRTLSVLVAEDNLINQEVARAMLTRRGHSVDFVGDGRAAVDAALKKDYDVVLMDIQMPELDGLEATQLIRGRKPAPRPRIVALTANVLPGERERCLQSGMDAYLAKPYSARDFFAVLEGDAHEPAKVVPPPAPTARPSGKLVDLDELRADLRAAGIEESLPVLVKLFLRDGPGRMTAIEKAVAAKNATLIASSAHSLRSAAGAGRASRLMNALASMERAAKSGDVGGAAAQLESVAGEHRAVREWLEKEDWKQ
jgi:CheY-like chemotaxis protein